MKTPDGFIEEYYGKSIDDDGGYGVQCVDGYRVFCKWIGISAYPTGTGWADGYWYKRFEQALSYENFEFIEDVSALRKGDWCFWAQGSSCPSSHVAMFTEDLGNGYGSFFGQNQGSFRGFSIATIKMDILGAFRWKGWESQTMVTFGTTFMNVNVNIRVQPTTSAAVVGTATKGSSYPVYGIIQTGGYIWYQIDGGWIASDGNWVKFGGDTVAPEAVAELERKIDYYLYVIGEASRQIEQADKILKGEY